ncbi:MAG: hypothetical protein FJ303_13235 [Planctomycetes bacterium]|nr:hypothetical protein [Planctomycetota bacterium]
MPEPKRIAAVITEYRRHSHADVIVGKILEGYRHDGKVFPNLRVVSMFVDQFPKNDWSRDLAKRHNFTIYDNIADAVTLRRKEVAVDGVIIIGEHGTYPRNARGQIQYPRRRFFEAVTDVFAKHRRVVPVFSDKHLAYNWADARWMYDRARDLMVPFMAGSSIPVTWRRPSLRLPRGCELTEAVAIGYGPFEGYGFHALEGLQCMAERRRGGETGVRSVTCLSPQQMWDAVDRGVISRELLDAAMSYVPAHATGDVRKLTLKNDGAGAFLIDYRDGFKGVVAMLNGWVHDSDGSGSGFTFAGRIRGEPRPVGCQFYLFQPDPFAHFEYLLKAIDAMMQTGHPAYPVERTLLTTGLIDAVMISRAEKNRRVDTPYLDIRYQPTEWGFAVDPLPRPIKR